MGLNQGRENEETRQDGLSRKFTLLVAVFFEIQQTDQQNDRQNDNHLIEHSHINIFRLPTDSKSKIPLNPPLKKGEVEIPPFDKPT